MLPEKKKKLRGRLLTLLFIIFNVVVIAVTARSQFRDGAEAEKLRNVQIRWGMILPAFACFVAAITAESFKYLLIMKKTAGRGSFKLALYTVVLGRYYDNITPFGAGGQPFQIYFLSQNGMETAHSAAVPLAGFMSTQFGFIILAVAAFAFRIVSGFFHGEFQDVIRVSGYIGLACYSAVPILILVFTFFPHAASSLINCFVRVLAKLRLVKNSEEKAEKIRKNVGGYSDSVRQVIRMKGVCAVILVLSFLYQLALCSIPYFLLHAFGGDMGYFECIVSVVSIYAAITIIPTPGNSGAAEGSFYAVFSSLVQGYVFWAMLIWRFFCFYVFIAAGAFIYGKKAIDAHRNKRRLTSEQS